MKMMKKKKREKGIRSRTRRERGIRKKGILRKR